MPLLGPNQYGKAEIRLVRVVRDGAVHHVQDLNVSVALSGEMADVHLSGDNAAVLPTDTMKNTVYAFAQRHGVGTPEAFGARLARHFVTAQPTIHRARVRLASYAWDRIATPGDDAHSFVRSGGETRTAQVTFDTVAGESWEILSGLTGLTVMNTTGSEFRGYVKDGYTTLPETDDRVLATDVTALWRHAGTDAGAAGDWDASWAAARTHLLEAFAGTYSRSLQQTLHAMGARVVEQLPGVEEIRLSLPNKHHFLVDLAPFSLENPAPDGAIYHAADRPYGLIEATVLRDGADARIPADLTGGGLA
ncbi:factor-independent urate hydroxylase [Streptomyces sp. SBT349]|uniref:factor-independent urate hydroxylase n=1 Tax=Streptomyces sp. SBT349 TaxID=1580539 RepID=UPI00066E56CF|nr:urate oxidase [Streptomyces sp. SBT349]